VNDSLDEDETRSDRKSGIFSIRYLREIFTKRGAYNENKWWTFASGYANLFAQLAHHIYQSSRGTWRSY